MTNFKAAWGERKRETLKVFKTKKNIITSQKRYNNNRQNCNDNMMMTVYRSNTA